MLVPSGYTKPPAPDDKDAFEQITTLSLQELTKLERDLVESVRRLEKEVDSLENDTTMSPLGVLAILKDEGSDDVELEHSSDYDTFLEKHGTVHIYPGEPPLKLDESTTERSVGDINSSPPKEAGHKGSGDDPTSRPSLPAMSAPLPPFDQTGEEFWLKCDRRIKAADQKLGQLRKVIEQQGSDEDPSQTAVLHDRMENALQQSSQTARSLLLMWTHFRKRQYFLQKKQERSSGDAGSIQSGMTSHPGTPKIKRLSSRSRKRISKSRESLESLGSLVLCESYLMKRGNLFKSWKRRLFKLTNDGMLRYYNSKGILLAEIDVFTAKSIGIDTGLTRTQSSGRLPGTLEKRVGGSSAGSSGSEFNISLELPTRTYYLACASQDERDLWVSHLQSFMGMVSESDTDIESSVDAAAGSGGSRVVTPLADGGGHKSRGSADLSFDIPADHESEDGMRGERDSGLPSTPKPSETSPFTAGGSSSSSSSSSSSTTTTVASTSAVSTPTAGVVSKKRRRMKRDSGLISGSSTPRGMMSPGTPTSVSMSMKPCIRLDLSRLEWSQLMQPGVLASFQEEFEDVAMIEASHADRKLLVTMHSGVSSTVTEVSSRILASFLKDCGSVACQSFLKKKADGRGYRWNDRWCVLLKNNRMEWYISKDETKPAGSIDLNTLVSVERSKSKTAGIDHVFEVVTTKRKIRFAAASSVICNNWIDFISIFSTHQRQKQLSDSEDDEYEAEEDLFMEHRKRQFMQVSHRIDPVIF